MILPEKPQLLPWAKIVTLPDRLLCYCGDRMVAFQGKACESFLPSVLKTLNGSHTVSEVYALFPAETKPAIEQIFKQLSSRNLLIAAHADGKSDRTTQLFFGAQYGIELGRYDKTMESSSILVCGNSSVAAATISHLQEAGLKQLEFSEEIPTTTNPATATLTMCCPGSDQVKDIARWNETAVKNSSHWLFASANYAKMAFAGPLFVPPDTGCFECFLRRRQSHSFLAGDFERLEGGLLQIKAPRLATDMIAAMTTAIAIRWLVAQDPFLPGRCQVLEWDSSPKISNHTLHRVPRCPRCSRTHHQSTTSPWGVGLVSNAL